MLSKKFFIRLFLIIVVLLIPAKIILAIFVKDVISDAFAGSLLGFAVSLIGINTVRKNNQDKINYYRED